MEKISRELLLAFWKVHELHHASQEPIYGQWIIEELRRHGYNVSPGTVYPMLARMARNGWLRADGSRSGTPTRRKPYSLTAKGRDVLRHLREQVIELHREIVLESGHGSARRSLHPHESKRPRQKSKGN